MEDNFTFTITQDSILTVTDGSLPSERYEVINCGTSLGLTDARIPSVFMTAPDFDTASSDPNWSTGTWLLTAGTYDISIAIVEMVDDDFFAGIRLYSVDPSPVPLPAALSMFTPALLGFLGWRCKVVTASSIIIFLALSDEEGCDDDHHGLLAFNR